MASTGYHEVLFAILAAVIILLIYGSLYPWQFTQGQFIGNPLTILLHAWKFQPGRRFISDVIINIAIYVPLGMSGYLALRRYRSVLLSLAGPVVIGTVLSASIEMTQLFTPHRDCSAIDLLNNIIGSTLGVAAGILFVKLTDLPLRPHYRLPDKVAMGLLFTWVAWLLFPFFPILWLPALRARTAEFIHGAVFSPVPLLVAATVWYAAGRLIVAIRWWRPRALLTACLLLLPVQFDMVGRFPIPAEWIGALLGVIAFWIFGSERQSGVYAGLALLIALVLAGIAPFHFSRETQSFSWIPFSGVLNNNWQASIAVLLGKLYKYGAAIWLMHRAGMRLWHATALVALILACIEGVQLFTPGHVPEITDPILAVLLGFGFQVLGGGAVGATSPLRGTILRKA